MVGYAVGVVGLIGFAIGMACLIRLREWERHLYRTRITIHFKGRPQLSPRLIDWLLWARQLETDKRVNGQVLYKMGGTTIALRKLEAKDHGKTVTKTVKEPT